RTASSGSYCWLRSIALATSSYFFPRCFGTLACHLDAQRASGALDHLHGRLDVVGVEVLQLELRNLADLLAVDLADLFLVRLRGAFLHARCLLQERRRRRRLGDEDKCPVLTDRDLDRDHL